MATRKRHTPQQVVRKLTQADRMLAEGNEIADVCRELQVSEQTFYRWRNQFGGLKADDVKRLKDLERENATLKPGDLLERGLLQLRLGQQPAPAGSPSFPATALRRRPCVRRDSLSSSRTLVCIARAPAGWQIETSSTLSPPLVHARPSRHMAIPTERALGPVGCTIFVVR